MRKMSRNLVAVLAVWGTLCVVRAAEDNPYTKVKVGDWVEYTMTTTLKGQNTESPETILRHEFIKKTDTEVTVELTTQIKNTPPMKQTTVIPLNQKYTPGKPTLQDVEYKELGTGNETLTVAGKSFETKWIEVEWNFIKQPEMKGKTKTWISKDIPSDGVIKVITDLPQGKTIMLLKDFGFGK